MEPLLLQGLLVHVVADSNLSLRDKVHLEYFFLFVIYHILVFFVAEMPWLQSKGDIVEEFTLFVLLRIEEETEVVEDIVEEIVDNDSSLD